MERNSASKTPLKTGSPPANRSAFPADPDARPPLVSIAVPLYRSIRFVEIISENIRRQDYPNLEIIISDRHCQDRAIEVLKERFSGDPRIRFLSADDQLGWVAHFNLLLNSAHGEYFLWMPHDDSYDGSWVPELVAHLENHPDVILAFGAIDIVAEKDHENHGFIFAPPPVSPEIEWSIWTSLKLLVFWNYAIAFRGVFRRERVLQSNLQIRPTRDLAGADVWWGFGLSLEGRLDYLPSCRCKKKFYRSSTHARSGYGWSNAVDSFRVPRRYLAASSKSLGSKIVGTLCLFLIATSWGVVLMLPAQGLIRRVRMKGLRGNR